MSAYELAANGNYRLLPVSEAQRINSQVARWWGEAGISMAAMAHMICSPNDHETVVLFSSAGEDMTDSVLPNSLLSSLSPQDTEPILRALKRRRPAYLRFGNFLANFWNDRYYILQENGSYRVGSNPMTDLIDRFGTDPIYNAIRWRKERAIEENSRQGKDDRPFSHTSPIDRDVHAREWHGPWPCECIAGPRRL